MKIAFRADKSNNSLLRPDAHTLLQVQNIAFPAAHNPVGAGIDQLADIFYDAVDRDHFSQKRITYTHENIVREWAIIFNRRATKIIRLS
jgi:hypothetical protein